MSAVGTDVAPVSELELLRSVVEGTAHSTGDDFLRNLVRRVAEAMGVHHAFVSELLPNQRIRTLAFWSNGSIVDNIEYDLVGTPCEEVIAGDICHIPSGVQAKYAPREAGIESYLGVPLKSQRARCSATWRLRRTADAERAAPAVHTSASSRPGPPRNSNGCVWNSSLARARNATAICSTKPRSPTSTRTRLALHPRQPRGAAHPGHHAGGSAGHGRHVARRRTRPMPQRRLNEAFASIGRGTDTSGVVLELRRKDNGKPGLDPVVVEAQTRAASTRARCSSTSPSACCWSRSRPACSEQNRLPAGGDQGGPQLRGDRRAQRRRWPACWRRSSSVAATDATVLITGETGTGKELIARAIHSAQPAPGPARSSRSTARRCRPGLVESELFGHETGAFTGAIARRIGRFELAARRHDLPRRDRRAAARRAGEAAARAAGARVRARRRRRRRINVDVRVIAATNRDLPRAVGDGAFRARISSTG